MKTNNIKLNIQDNIATLCFDLENEKINKLSFAVLEELKNKIQELKTNTDIKVLLITSAKKHIFIAGADINEIKSVKEEDEVYDILMGVDEVFTSIESLPFPTISVIDGACMGGGLELALSCTFRVATNTSRVKIALPEVKLGIFPGFGGTQRLPKLIGLIKSLDMILTGKTLDAKRAYSLGVIDKYFSQGQFEYKLQDFIDGVILGKIKKHEPAFNVLESLSFSRDIIFKKAKQSLNKKLHPSFTAPFIALDVIQNSYEDNIKDGIKKEARAFAKLAITPESKHLIDLFFVSEDLKKDYKDIEFDTKINNTTIIGNGVMGKGIIWLFSKYAKEVRIKLRKLEQAQGIISATSKLYSYFVKSRKMTKKQVELKLNKLSYTNQFNGLSRMDLVVEAIIEDKEQKKQTYKQVEMSVNKNTIIATNTSSISVNSLSQDLEHKDRFIGMHFFNPVNKMPLVEVIASKETSELTIAKSFEFLRRCGKTPILVGDCAGFLVNRVLIPFINEAGYILEEGESISNIDKILKEFGMPMGAFELTDVVGIDVGYKVASILEESYGNRMKINSILLSVYNDLKLLGKKANKGFYTYETNSIDKENQDVLKLITNTTSSSSKDIINRTIFIMINEASRCLEEGIIKKVSYLDFAMIAGAGFPAFRGGLLKYADEIGINVIINELENYKELYGDRYTPSKLLYELQENKKTFYTGEELWN